MYFPYFISYITIGLVISLAVFWWALSNGQFKDQQRARFLPLEEKSTSIDTRVSTHSRYETYVLMFLAVAGLSASAAVLIFSLLKGKYF